ncbi:MAG: nicotinate-nucleotide adenylyltransferase [Spongiibacteraceae bacterium]|jgi:nicotinate-nucleotide adenylyltransferase|nr:nicotinate-nucleotide adenylyltransferase [Spongiibacteraceae bacterium]
MNSQRRHVAVLGGTFDPFHNAHLRVAIELRERLGLDELRLMPSHTPPHRDRPGAQASQRLAMVRLAVADEPGLVVDDRELRRRGASYTVLSLEELRAELGPACSLSLVMGADAFAGLQSWHRWRELLTLAHLIVVDRPGFEPPVSGELHALWQGQVAPERLHEAVSGLLTVVAVPPLAISATQIRTLVGNGRSPRGLVPDAVWDYICRHRLYHGGNASPEEQIPHETLS